MARTSARIHARGQHFENVATGAAGAGACTRSERLKQNM